jgi:hypothetical protein
MNTEGKIPPSRHSIRLVRHSVSYKIWMGAAVQRGLEPGSRGIAIVRSRYQATTSKDTASWKRLSVWPSDLQSVEINDGTIINCIYESRCKVVNKSNIQSKTRSIISETRKYIHNRTPAVQIFRLLTNSLRSTQIYRGWKLNKL